MNIENILAEIEIEGEEEIKKIKEEFDFELKKLKEEYDNRLKNLSKEWNELIQKELNSLREKKELDLKAKIELLILESKNEILENFKKFSLEKLNSINESTLKEFYKNEILRNVDSKGCEIHFERERRNLFDDEFRKNLIDLIKKNHPEVVVKFVEDNETYVKGMGYIAKISLFDSFNEVLSESILDISKILFGET